MNIDDYVIIAPQKKHLNVVFFNIRQGSIQINTNIDHVERFITDDSYISDTAKGNIIGSVSIICKPGLFKNEVNQYVDGQFIKKEDLIYSVGVENTIFCNEESNLLINHYPVCNLLYFNTNHNYALCVIPSEDVAGFLAKMAIKRLSANYNYRTKAYFSLHASCVTYLDMAFVFIAGGRAGKTTSYLNLVSDRYFPMNDDVLFWKCEQDDITIDSIPLKVNIRENSLRYLRFPLDLTICNKGFDNELYVSTDKLFNKTISSPSKLKAIFIPEINHKITTIKRINSKDYLKRILRSCMTHDQLTLDENFVESFNRLMKYSIYKIEISDDAEEFLTCFNAFVNTVSI